MYIVLPLNNIINIDRRQMNLIRIQLPDGYDLFDLDDALLRRRSDVRVKVSRGFMEDNVAFRVSFPSFDERPITLDRFFVKILATIDHSTLLRLRSYKSGPDTIEPNWFSPELYQSTNTGRSIESRYS